MKTSEIKKFYDMEKGSFFWYRILPGFITIALATSPIWTTFLGIYSWLVIYLGFIATYITYESILLVISNAIGYKRMRGDMARDWKGDLTKLNFNQLHQPELIPQKLSEVYHVIFIPIYKEPYEELVKTFDAIAAQDYPYIKNVIVAPAVEERAGEEQKFVIQKLKKRYAGKFGGFWNNYHPENIPGEIIGDACANLRWAGVHISKRLKKEKINSQHVIFSKFDADSRIHPKNLSALTYMYLVSKDRVNKFYSPAALIYSNNYWKVPATTRMFSAALSLGVVGEWVSKKRIKQSFSAYSGNFKLLEDINFWDASTGAEDTYFYWNALLHLDGKFEGVGFFLPVYMDAVEGKDKIASLKSLYKQQLRWGWGVLIMCIALQGMSNNKKINLIRKIDRFMVLFRVYNFTLTMSILLTFTMPLLTWLNGELEYSSISYLLPRVISYMLTASLALQLPQKYYIYKYYGGPPKESSVLFKLWWWLFESLVTLVNVWTYYLFPKLQAQYELTIGKERKKFFITMEGKLEK